MKRQRGGGNVNPPKVEKEVAAHAMGKKKGKKDVEQKKVVKSIVDQEEKKEERKEIKGEDEQVVAGDNNNNDNVMGWNFEEHMPWLGGVVDEQMSWGSTWFPWWDMDFNGDAFSSLYNDVVWDDDIWNHNKEIPITLDRKV